jgi:hypothetical protein
MRWREMRPRWMESSPRCGCQWRQGVSPADALANSSIARTQGRMDRGSGPLLPLRRPKHHQPLTIASPAGSPSTRRGAALRQLPAVAQRPWAAPRRVSVRAAAIAIGDKVPDSKFRYFDAEGNMKELTTDQLCKGKKVVLFAVPGAFTP